LRNARDVPGVAGVGDVPWWGTVSSAAAPVLLVTGLTAAAKLQPPKFDGFNSTVSALAGEGADYSWVMTLTFVVVGMCDVLTGLALRAAALPGRVVLMGAGVAGILVAAFPTHLGGSQVHALWAGIGFAGIILWPVFAMRRGPDVPWALRPSTCVSITVTLSLLTLWFAAEQATHGANMGLAERTAGLAQALCPLIAVMSCRLSRTAPELADDLLEPEH
jgi:hypothetical membrane protein